MGLRHVGIIALALAAAAPARAADVPIGTGSGAACSPAVTDIASSAGQDWLAQNGWRYPNAASARAAWNVMVTTMSPWPDWAQPQMVVLKVGTRLQMAMAPGQPDNQLGAFLTFDGIATIQQVRDLLAVRGDWKPAVDHVVTYEITRDVAVAMGPIGPQVDPTSCRLLPGGWTQVELLVNAADRMSVLKVVDDRPLR